MNSAQVVNILDCDLRLTWKSSCSCDVGNILSLNVKQIEGVNCNFSWTSQKVTLVQCLLEEYFIFYQHVHFFLFFIKTFPGNYDRNGVQTRSFNPPIYGRFVRIQPRGWRSHISMRLELYGCPWSKCCFICSKR